MKMGSTDRVRVESISTGAINLDARLASVEIPRGRVTEIYGPESSGKTIALPPRSLPTPRKPAGPRPTSTPRACRSTPTTRSKAWGRRREPLVSQPDTGEQAMEICEILVRSGDVDVVVIDSVAALVPKAEIEGDNG